MRPGHPTVYRDRARAPDANLDGLDWKPAEDRAFSDDLLRIAVRQGIATRTGILVEVKCAANLGHADQIRISQMSADHARAALNETGSMHALHRMFPGMAEADAELDERVRESTDKIARRAERDLAEDLAAPAHAELVDLAASRRELPGLTAAPTNRNRWAVSTGQLGRSTQ